MKILGIDPGYERLGVAVIEKDNTDTLLYSDCIKTSAELPFSERLLILGKSIETIIKDYSFIKLFTSIYKLSNNLV